MSDFQLFYKVSSRDRCNNIVDISIKRPKPVAVLEEHLVSSEVKFADKINYYKPPKLDDYPLDLNAGFEFLNCRSNVDTKWNLNKVCFYLMNKGELLQSVEESGINYEDKCCGDCDEMECNYEVFCHLGLLRTLMKTPYAGPKWPLEWSVFATFFNNKLYLRNRSEHQGGMDRNSSHYFKFEQYCFSNDPQVEQDTTVPIDDDNKIRYIFCTQLKNFKLVYSTEVNGIESKQKLENLKDVEKLQQCRFVQTMLMKSADKSNKRKTNWKSNFRIFNWWIKAHLAAVDVMYMGFKTSDGFVQEPAEQVLVKHMPQNQRWTPKVCYQFLYNFLKMVISTMGEVDSPYTCYEFHYNFSTHLINYRIHEGKTEYSFLPDDYIAYLMK